MHESIVPRGEFVRIRDQHTQQFGVVINISEVLKNVLKTNDLLSGLKLHIQAIDAESEQRNRSNSM